MKRLLVVLFFPFFVLAALWRLWRRWQLREDLDWQTVGKPGSLIDIDGYTVHYIDRGGGPAIVFVHGLGGQTFSYREMIPRFARDHRVIAVDLKGYGYSQRTRRTDLSARGQVAMLRGLLERLGVRRAVFVGHSMGGAIVQRFAATYPDIAEAVVLAGSITGDERPRRFLPDWVVRPWARLFAKLVGTRLLKYAYRDRSVLTPEVREEYVRPARIKGSLDGLLKASRDASRDPRIDRSRIAAPVLILAARHDRVMPMRVTRRLQELFPAARVHIIETAGHMLLEERPDEAERAIRDFLRDVSRRERAAASA